MDMDVLLRGIVMGFAIAAPVGPIGLLCIRRTLADGRAAGLATGLGAATADAVYGMMVAVGFAATGLLVSYATPMAIGGGALIVWLGAMSLRGFWNSRGGDVAPAPARAHKTVLTSWATTFLLTMSNPMTILAFVGMVAGLGAAAEGSVWAPYWLVAGVFTGSALWWLFLVHLALFARTRITPGVTRWFDAVSGAVLVIWGAKIVFGAVV
ncbi:LysE family transporter [Shimia sp. CNT1-13L.2]|uniref:LysE/ArgO family amino acid transporter n=1 Tax=Shimia sp. CNT1-13L.2 TaxID=2959663 RepID=UPI0020CF6F91|nr:LysE family transporter [Shimia sp. CNT1-13L.2]MCP9481225.1 LysE family transporter [Shimia sp. CNT1-13L.2]